MKIITNTKDAIYIQKKDLIFLFHSKLNKKDLEFYIPKTSNISDLDFFKIEGEDLTTYLKNVKEIITYDDYLTITNLPLNERLPYIREYLNKELFVNESNRITAVKLRYMLLTVKDLLKVSKKRDYIIVDYNDKSKRYTNLYKIKGLNIPRRTTSKNYLMTLNTISLLDICKNHLDESGNYRCSYDLENGKIKIKK